jgi:thermostable 8-oxoguanine DNA glycosylase
MINPDKIIDFNRTEAEMQELILFLVVVAGKKASTMARELDKFLRGKSPIYNPKVMPPFYLLRQLSFGKRERLEEILREHSFGQYNRVSKAFFELAYSGLDLRTCSLEDLMKIHGIGRKSASCFLAWTRKGVRVAMLDTHLLKEIAKEQEKLLKNRDYLGKWGRMLLEIIGDVQVPKATPSSKTLYNKLENFWLTLCDGLGEDPTEYDLKVWKKYSK